MEYSPDDIGQRSSELLGLLAGQGAILRPAQTEAIEAVVAQRRRALVVQRTGFGKSAVYFIATKLLRERGAGPTLVVSPLLALMRDQVAAACLELGLRRAPHHPVLFGVDEPLYLSAHRAAGMAPAGGVVVHVMRNHGPQEALTATEQQAWLEAAARQAGVKEGDIVEQRFLAKMTVSGGLPTAAGGGLAGRPPVSNAGRARVLLAGDWVGPVGLLSDAAVASGQAAGRTAAEQAATATQHPVAAANQHAYRADRAPQ